MSPPTLEQLHTFYAQERQVFAKLVINFARPPAQSLLVMATWLWLEDCGFDNIFSLLLVLPNQGIMALANEAVMCFQCVSSPQPPPIFHQIPLTAGYMGGNISLPLIYTRRCTTIIAIRNYLNTICSRIFSDILLRVLPLSYHPLFPRFHNPISIPGFPHPTFGGINVFPHQGMFPIPNNNLNILPSDPRGWNASSVGPEKERTLFITFSRGFPVSEEEVRFLFTMRYGESCVRGIYMQESNRNFHEQPLYARVVLDSVVTMDRVLQGSAVKKLKFNRKHIWARKYEARE